MSIAQGDSLQFPKMSTSEEKITESKQESYRHPSVFGNIDGVIYPPYVTYGFLNQIKDLPIQEGDVFVNTYPKSGTTWVSEIVWQIFFDGAVDMTPIHQRVPHLEWHGFFPHTKKNYSSLREFYLKQTFPRFFETHQHYHQAAKGDEITKPKYLCVVRNPKDVAVSYFWHYKVARRFEFDRSWDEFFEMFLEGNAQYGSWFDHVLGWWAHRDDPSILFLKYEDMKKNLPEAVQQIAKFLGKELSEDKIEHIAEQTTFNAMSDSKGRFHDDESYEKLRIPGSIKFIRKGEVGDWRNYFSKEQNKRFDARYENMMAGSGLELEFE